MGSFEVTRELFLGLVTIGGEKVEDARCYLTLAAQIKEFVFLFLLVPDEVTHFEIVLLE